MLLIHCPYCQQSLPELEFAYAGEAHIARPEDPNALSDEAWRDHLFIRSNPKGVHFERWRHIHGCSKFFNAARDTVSDEFLTTYPSGAPKPDLSELQGDLK
jgi:sarcosine oxidase subunit delta